MFHRDARLSLLLSLAAALMLAGCTSAAASPSAAAPTTPGSTGAASPPQSQTPAASFSDDAPAWLSIELTDVTTGEKFTIESLGGPVLIQNMAQWCPTCRSQAEEVKKLRQAFGDDEGELAIVSLDIDVNEDAASLKAYAAKGGYAWRFAVAPADLLREMGDLYGAQFLNPPSAPMLIVNSSGAVLPLPAGVKSAATLHETIAGYMGV